MFEKLFGKKDAVPKTDISKRFNLIGRVGQGSMSRVWKAEDYAAGNRLVALKVLDLEKTKRYEGRFSGLNKPGEAEIAMSLHHPHIVQTLEAGVTTEDEPFLVMEYIEGSGLGLLVDLQSEQMRRYRLRYMIQIGEALHYFHQQNWIHRDLCPRNVMVAEDNQIKLIDFGLAVPNTADFRKPGNRTGTANYMAPELIKRQPTDQRIDVFAYAVTCFEMYAKRHPWDAAVTLDAVLQHINKPPEEITALVPKIDAQIASVIMKGLAADPDDRWSTAAEMVKEFRESEARLVQAARRAAAQKQKKPAAKPVSAQSTLAQPTSEQPSSAKPASAQSASAQPASSKPASAKPAVAKPKSGPDAKPVPAVKAKPKSAAKVVPGKKSKPRRNPEPDRNPDQSE
ncbi:MAG: protein kinase [Planctomycetaceae bacterium]